MPTRKLDQRRRGTPFLQAVQAYVQRYGTPRNLRFLTMSVKPRRFQTYDSVGLGVIVVWGGSDLPTYRALARRILGGPVRAAHADSLGTVYVSKEY